VAGRRSTWPRNSDGGGPYRQPPFGSKSYCPWLANDCTGTGGHPAGVGGQYCSYSRFQHVEVRLVSNTTLTLFLSFYLFLSSIFIFS